MAKKCSKCGVEKELCEYYKDKRHKDGLLSSCKKCHNKVTKKYRQSNKAKEKRKENYQRPEVKARVKKRISEYRQSSKYKEYYKKSDVKDRRNNRKREWQNKKHRTDPIFRMNHSISSGLFHTLKFKGLSKNGRHWEDLVGYTIQEYIDYITPLFCKKIVNGKEIIMSWNNHGTKWELDHIHPSSLCGNTEADIIYNWRLDNLQPLWKEDNQEKKDSLNWVRDPNKYIKIAQKERGLKERSIKE